MAKILVCADGFFRAFSPFALEPYIESFINTLARNGNDVLVYINNDYSGIRHKIKRTLIKRKIKSEIKKFNPDIVFAFNNSFDSSCFNILKKIYILASDTPVYWNNIDLIKKNPEKFYVCYFNDDMKKVLEKDYHIPSQRQIKIPYSTDIHHDKNLKQHIDISFIGNFYNDDTFLPQEFIEMKNKTNQKEKIKELFIKIIDEIRESKSKTDKAVNLINQLEEISGKKINTNKFISSVYGMLTAKTRTRLLSELLDMDLHVYTWNGNLICLSNNDDLFKIIETKQVCSIKDNEDVYNDSYISLNLPHGQVDTGFSWRVCDILASNALLISNPSKDLEILFGGIIPTYTNEKELREKIEYYLSHDKERRKIVEKCHEIIDKNHRYNNVFKILEKFTEQKLVDVGNQGKVVLPSRTQKIQKKYLRKNKGKVL